MMAEPLDGIVQAVKSRDYILSLHYWEERVKDMTRPSPTAVIESIGKDEPEIIESYDDDPRGASCLLLGVNGRGRQIHSVLGYKSYPIKIITAYYQADDIWINGRTRR